MRKSFYLSGLLAFCFILHSVAVRATGVPVITTNLVNDTVCSGSMAQFTFIAIDTSSTPSTLSFTWEVSPDGGTTWDTITSGVTTHDSLSQAAAITTTMFNGIMIKCIVWDATDSAVSSVATLTVDTANSGIITGNAQVCVQSSITFGSTVAGGVWSNVNHAIDTIDNIGDVYGKSQGFDTVKYTVTNTCGVTTSWVILRVDTTVVNLPITGPTTTCVGHSITLMNGNTLGEWVWTASNDNATINDEGMVIAYSGGIDTFTYSFENACNAIDTSMSVQIDTVLAHGTISGPTGVCAGSWITLSDAVTGGDWLSSNSGIAITDMSGNVTGVSQGTAVISYYLSNGCGVSTTSATITVFAMASAIIGNDSIGIGGTRALFDTTLDGTWSSSNTTSITINSSGVATGVTAGSATITYSVTNLCGTTYSTLTLYTGTPNAGIITGTDSVCATSSVVFSDTVAGGVWTSSNTGIATVNDTGLVTGVSYGSAVISYTFTNGFGTTSVLHSIFVNTPPIDSIDVQALYSVGGSYTFYGFTKNTSGWVHTNGTWTSSNPSVAQFIGIGFLVTYGFGSTTITFSATNSCGTTDTSFVINIPNPNGISQVANKNSMLNVYPNPSGGDFTINLVSAIDEQAVVTITNIIGEKVKEFSISTNQPSELKLDQPDGVYFLDATASGGKYSAKITITK